MNKVNSKITESDVFQDTPDMNDLLLADLASIELISVRAISTCQNNELNSLFKILEYFSLHGNFLSLHNCGKMTDNELQDLCKKYLPFYPIRVVKDSLVEYPIANCIFLQVKQINDIPLDKLLITEKLSLRALNTCLHNKLNSLFKILDFFNINGSFKSLRNCGNNTDKELQKFCLSLSVKYQKLTQSVDKFNSIQLIKDESFFTKTFKDFFIKNDIQILDLFDENNKLKFFSLLDKLINTNYIFNNIDKAIFGSYYNNSYKPSNTLDSIAKSLNLSRESIRQRKTRLFYSIPKKFNFIYSFNLNEIVNYGIDGSKNFYKIDNSVFEPILLNENISFNCDFFCFIFEMLLKDSHLFLSDKKLLMKEVINIWKFKYFIKKQLCVVFDYEKFVEDMYYKVNAKNKEPFILNFRDYLTLFFKSDNRNSFDEIYNICSLLILNEFNLTVDNEGSLNFEQNIRR